MSKIGTQYWYAVQTRSNFEKRIVAELTHKNLQPYCPMFQELHQWADRKKLVERPVFPGYVFARFVDSAATRLAIAKTAGTVRILGSGTSSDSALEPVSDKEIEGIRRLLESGSPCEKYPYLHEGDIVRVKRGALKDLEGILVRIKNDARLVLSLELLSQSVATEVDVNDVEVVKQRTKTAVMVA